MPITGFVYAPALGRVIPSMARPAAPASGLAPSALGPVAPFVPMLSVQSAPSRVGHPLPHLHARMNTVSNRSGQPCGPSTGRRALLCRSAGAHSGAWRITGPSPGNGPYLAYRRRRDGGRRGETVAAGRRQQGRRRACVGRRSGSVSVWHHAHPGLPV